MADPLARSFGRAAVDYERGRPEWPLQAVERPAAALGLTREADVLDLAAGTGKLTRVLVARFGRVMAVEPDDGMREVLAASVPDAEALAGTAEQVPLVDDSVDACFVGDAFHWFDAGAALRELARVLRAGGGLVLLWKRWGPDDFDPRLPCLRAAATGRGVRAGGAAWRRPLRVDGMAQGVRRLRRSSQLAGGRRIARASSSRASRRRRCGCR